MSRTDAAYHNSGEGETPPHVGAYNRGRNFLTASGVDGKCDFAGGMGLV